jgi:hypothetical protein
MAAIYDVMQLATAVEPWFMRTLLEEAREPVLYLDPDIQIFAPLDELGELAREHSIVLTPHQVRPRDYDPKNVADTSVQLAGGQASAVDPPRLRRGHWVRVSSRSVRQAAASSNSDGANLTVARMTGGT